MYPSLLFVGMSMDTGESTDDNTRLVGPVVREIGSFVVVEVISPLFTACVVLC